jgi:hypothetical protein
VSGDAEWPKVADAVIEASTAMVGILVYAEYFLVLLQLLRAVMVLYQAGGYVYNRWLSTVSLPDTFSRLL